MYQDERLCVGVVDACRRGRAILSASTLGNGEEECISLAKKRNRLLKVNAEICKVFHDLYWLCF